jgi:hypothetical protein
LRFGGADGNGFDCGRGDAVGVWTLVNASRTYSLAGVMLTSAVVLGSATATAAAPNYAPPSGAVIDLGASGGAIPSGATLYTSAPFYIDETDVVNGVIPITFAFRNDYPGLLEFWGADLFDVNTRQKNLLVNGNFSGAGLDQAPSWTYTPLAGGLGFPAAFFSSGCPAPGNCWVDATSGGYDELSQNLTSSAQSVVLNAHDQYEISFFVSDPNAQSSWTYRQYSTIDSSSSPFGGNATDILAFVGKVGPYTNVQTSPPPPAAAPEPSTWAMMLLGFTGLGFLGYRRSSARASTSQT